MSDVVKTLRSELAALERELLADARYVKVQRIKELLTAYSPGKEITSPSTLKRLRSPRKAVRKATKVQKRAPSIDATLSKAKLVRREIEAMLTENGQVHRKEILARMVSKGFMGKEKNPMASLAAYLSGWRALFETDGNGNFKLRADGH